MCTKNWGGFHFVFQAVTLLGQQFFNMPLPTSFVHKVSGSKEQLFCPFVSVLDHICHVPVTKMPRHDFFCVQNVALRMISLKH